MKRINPKRLILVGLLAVAAAAATSGQASAATLTVCPSGCAFSQIAPAVAAAKDGDTISIAPGTYAGGVTIDVSVKLAGAGARLGKSRRMTFDVPAGAHHLTLSLTGSAPVPSSIRRFVTACNLAPLASPGRRQAAQ